MRLPENWWLIILLFLLLCGMLATLIWGKKHSRHGYGQRHFHPVQLSDILRTQREMA